jgi:hypothetical protein
MAEPTVLVPYHNCRKLPGAFQKLSWLSCKVELPVKNCQLRHKCVCVGSAGGVGETTWLGLLRPREDRGRLVFLPHERGGGETRHP